jgi:hypothetical protein
LGAGAPFSAGVFITVRREMPRVLHKEIEPSPIYFRETAMLQLRDIAARPDTDPGKNRFHQMPNDS